MKITTCLGEQIEVEDYYSATTYLGLRLVRADDGRIFDIEGGEPYEINDATLKDVEANIVAWLDDPSVQSADDFTGETRADWDFVRTSV